MYIILTYIYL